MKKLILLIAALALAACASLNASADQSELSLNQQKWQDANISHYRYNLAISCLPVQLQASGRLVVCAHIALKAITQVTSFQ